MRRITPLVRYADPAAALHWLAEAFGLQSRPLAEGPGGRIERAEVRFEGGALLVGAAPEGSKIPRSPDDPVPEAFCLRVDDVDAHCARARSAGAKIVSGPADTDHDDRVYVVEDLEGHRWTFGQRAQGARSTIDRVRALAPRVAERGDEIERERRIPDDLSDELRRVGCYRMIAPAVHGGDELALAEVLRVIEALACADAAVGWTVGQVALAQAILAHLPAETVAAIYAPGPDLMAAGAFAPKGRAARRDGGWHVSGQWPFATGCDRAAWLYVQCVVFEDRRVQLGPDGLPAVRLMLFPANEVEIVDTWRAVGLRGTASHDLRITRGLCPEEHSCALGGRPSSSGPLSRIPLMDYAGLLIAAVSVGVAQGALDDVTRLAASGKRPAFSRQRLAESPVVHDRLGESHMTLRTARALLHSQAEAAWRAAEADQPLPLVDRASLRATAAQVAALATRVVDTSYTLAGSSSVFDASPLQRRLRDIHTATQHAWNGRDHTGVLGALLVGERVDAWLF